MRRLLIFQLQKSFVISSSVLRHLYTIAAMVTIVARASGKPEWEYVAKPLLMPLLAGWYLTGIRQRSIKVGLLESLSLAALFFSWLGDVFLMFTDELFFLGGLSAFLIGHLCYIGAFNTGPFMDKPTFVRRNPWVFLVFILYAGCLLFALRNGIEGFLWIAVPVYALTIAGMAITAANRKGRVPNAAFVMTMIGALLFVLSDSIIALNKFGLAFDLAGPLIMLTYTVAQLLIIGGLMEQRRA